jgi:hypothetical protein
MKRRPDRGGAVHCGEQYCHKPTRQTLQGNAAMRLRLSALMWVHGLRDASREISLGGFDYDTPA